MKFNIFKYLAAASAALLGVSGLTGCQDNFDDMPAAAPEATLQPNTSIAEFKAEFWQDDNNYCVEIPAREDGSHYIISGRVISSDYQGNIFKCLYIQDGSAALAMSINQYNLYMVNRVGQEVVVDLTGMYAGKYNGMFQLGFPSWYATDQCYETSFMAPELFNAHVQYNGNPEPARIDTIVVSSFSDLSSDAAGLQKWQGQLVRFNNSVFANANNPSDNQLCNEYHSSGYNQSLQVCDGSGALNVRTSGYAKFWNMKLPEKACDVVGILSYYGTQGWQLLLNDADGIMNVGNPTQQGTRQKPYTVEDAVAMASTGGSGWVKGYIVGTVAPEVTEVTSDADVAWTAPFVVDNTVVIAPEPDTRDYTKCIVVSLTEGTKLYELANLADNPDRLGLTLSVQGRFAENMGMAAVVGNSGNASSFDLEGVEVVDPGTTLGDGSEASPYNVAQVIALGNPGTSAWVTGYVVGVFNYDNNSNLETTVPTTVNSCIAIAASPDVTDKTQTVCVQLPVGAVRTALNLKEHPELLGQVVSVYGSLEKYFGVAGVKNTSNYKVNGEGGGGDTPVTPGAGEGNGTEASPYNCAAVISLGNPGTKDQWVSGYIIGVINYSNNSSLEPGVSTSVNTCIAIADTPDETVKENCVAVQLPVGAVRDALNLVQNPGVLGKKVALKGTLTAYFGIAGLKETSTYKLLDGGEGGGGDTPAPVEAGTKEQPYTVDQVLALNNPGTESWVEGYIVGWTTNGTFSANFTAEGAVAANVLIASSANEQDPAKLVPVQLSSGTTVRAALNLVDNPGNLGKKVKVLGKLEAYFNKPGVKSTSDYVLE